MSGAVGDEKVIKPGGIEIEIRKNTHMGLAESYLRVVEVSGRRGSLTRPSLLPAIYGTQMTP